MYDKDMSTIHSFIKNKDNPIHNDLYVQYIQSIFDKTILRQLKRNIEEFELEVNISKSNDKLDLSLPAKDYTLDDKIITNAKSLINYISSLNIL